jgi:mRNA interferase MazF
VTLQVGRGDVWWADVPGDKVRPVLVLTRARFVPRLTSVVVAPVTTRIRGIPTEVELSVADGMPRDCAANFDNLLTIPKDRISRRILTLDEAAMARACTALRFAMGC